MIKLGQYLASLCLKSFKDLIFPAFCLHCEEPIKKGFLCEPCEQLLEALELNNRCLSCLKEFYKKNSRCSSCTKSAIYLNQTIAAFEYVGPIVSLIKYLKYQDHPQLAASLAAFAISQYLKAQLPLPDLIVPVPMYWLRKVDRGYNQSSLLAFHISKMINRPMKEVLTRRGIGYAQAGLNRQQREKQLLHTYQLNKKFDLSDQMILLVDDVMTTGTTLLNCAEVLHEGLPKSIYGLVVCKA